MKCDLCKSQEAYITISKDGVDTDLCSYCFEQKFQVSGTYPAGVKIIVSSNELVLNSEQKARLVEDLETGRPRPLSCVIEELPPYTEEALEYLEPWGVDRFGELEL